MMGFGEFARIIKRGTEELHGWLALDLFEIGTAQQVMAAELIGHEIPQWPALAETTLQGWAGFPGKIELGYTGRISATDPLLRTGANRDSIKVVVDELSLTEVTGSDRKEFLWMEMGTGGKHPIPPRPSLSIAAVNSLEFAADKLHETAVRALTGLKIEYAKPVIPGVP